MVTKNQLRLELFNILQGGILSVQTMDRLKAELSESELSALVSIFIELYPELKLQEKSDNILWLINIAKKYSKVKAWLDVSDILKGTFIEILDSILAYLNFRRQNSDVGSKDIFNSVYEYVQILRCRCDMREVPVCEQESKMLNKILRTSEPELNKLVMALLCYFSFDEEHIPLVEVFLKKKKDLVLNYVKIMGTQKRSFIF